MIYKAAIFDMDGTLVDTLEDIADSVNETLELFKFPVRSLDEIRQFVGNGARKLIERSLPAEKSSDEKFVDEVLKSYDGVYKKNLTNKTKLYDGIAELLTELNAKKIPLGICTNKQHFAALEIAEKILQPFKFEKIFGDEKGQPRKPNPARVLKIAESFNVQPAEVAYFGDTAVDMNTANNAGFLPVGVTWGFRPKSELVESGAKIIINHPLEILDKNIF